MLSNAKLDTAEAADGHVVDIVLPATQRKGGAEVAERVVAILETHARLGGQCIQINCFNSQTLRDAQVHPEKYADLQVRICGWNVRWNDMSRIEQDLFYLEQQADAAHILFRFSCSRGCARIDIVCT